MLFTQLSGCWNHTIERDTTLLHILNMQHYPATLVVIAKNEEDVIERCILSALPFVSDVVVVDTGSSDKTIEIAKKCGANVHQFTWIDDFSAARNHAMGYCKTPWALVLDADEWVLNAGMDLLSMPAPDFIGRLAIDSQFNAGQELQTSRTMVSRLLPAHVRYEGKVHEQPISALPRRNVDIVIGHTGYLKERVAAKRGRNMALLISEIQRRPNDPYLSYQLGKEYSCAAEHAKACEPYLKAIALSNPNDDWTHDLVVRAIYSLKEAGRHEKGIEVAGKFMRRFDESPDFYFVLADLLIEVAMVTDDTEQKQQYLQMMQSCWQKCIAIGERPELCGAVSGRGSYLAQQNLDNFHAIFGSI